MLVLLISIAAAAAIALICAIDELRLNCASYGKQGRKAYLLAEKRLMDARAERTNRYLRIGK